MKVLFLTHRVPYAPNRGDRVRAFHVIRTLSAHAELQVLSLAHDDEELRRAADLRRFGVEARAFRVPRARNLVLGAVSLPGSRPLTHSLLDSPPLRHSLQALSGTRRPDVVLAYCSGMARFALEPPLDACPLVLDMVDVDSEKWRSLAARAAAPRRWIYAREARTLSAFERRAAARAAYTLVVNEREREVLARLAPDANIRVVQNGIDLQSLRPAAAPAEDPCVVFCGVMNYEPNVEGVLWFARDVWPAVRARRPDAAFVVAGAEPTTAVRRLQSGGARIHVTGTVPDVREYLWQSAVSVAPLRTARGLQNKVLEAVAAGVPAVVTPQVAEGLPPQVRPACRVGESAEAFASHVLALLAMTGAERRQVAASARLSSLAWDAQLACLPGLLRNAIAGGAAV